MVSTLEANNHRYKHTQPFQCNTYAYTYTQTKCTHSRAQGWRKHKVETGPIYSLKSSLPHWSHLFQWGYISCFGLNLVAKWHVPLCSNTGVFTVSEVLNRHSAYRSMPCLYNTHKSQCQTICFPAYIWVSWVFFIHSYGEIWIQQWSSTVYKKTLYQHPAAWIKINWSPTDKFEQQHSTRQSCCVSPPLFVIFIEPLTQAVWQNSDLKIVIVNGREHKIGLFANDVIAFLKQSNNSLPVFMKIIEIYSYSYISKTENKQMFNILYKDKMGIWVLY